MLCFLPVTGRAEETAGNECNPVIEKHPEWQVIRIRPHENAFVTCTLARNQFNSLVSEAMAETGDDPAVYHSLFIGRLVDHPWLSRYLAMQALADPAWDAGTGRPTQGEINSFVRNILTTPELLEQIQVPLSGSGYTVTGAAVEKVLVVKANEIPYLGISEPVLVPYDAMVHFIMEKPAGGL